MISKHHITLMVTYVQLSVLVLSYISNGTMVLLFFFGMSAQTLCLECEVISTTNTLNSLSVPIQA